MAFAIKAKVPAEGSAELAFTAQKTMYDGRRIGAGDTLFIFDSETDGGVGLWGRGRVLAAEAVARAPGPARQTPRVSLTVGDIVRRTARLGRAELKGFKDWDDGRPETELNFKFYRQATNKIVGLSPPTAAFLDGFFAR